MYANGPQAVSPLQVDEIQRGGTVESQCCVDFSGAVSWRIGLEWSAFEHFTILAALGGSVSSDLAPEDRLRHDYFFGIAWNP